MTGQQCCKHTPIHFYQLLRWRTNSPVVLAINKDREIIKTAVVR